MFPVTFYYNLIEHHCLTLYLLCKCGTDLKQILRFVSSYFPSIKVSVTEHQRIRTDGFSHQVWEPQISGSYNYCLRTKHVISLHITSRGDCNQEEIFFTVIVFSVVARI